MSKAYLVSYVPINSIKKYWLLVDREVNLVMTTEQIRAQKLEAMVREEMRPMVLGLCEGRHPLPETVEGYIYPQQLKLDFQELTEQCRSKLQFCKELKLFVTGFTPALTTVINYCMVNSIPLVLCHYDRDTDSYIQQDMATNWKGSNQ